MIGLNLRYIGLASLLTLGLAHTIRAQDTIICFPNNAAINSAVNGKAVVGYAQASDINVRKNPTSPTVHLVNGGSIAGDLNASSSSVVFVEGGNVKGDLLADDSSQVTVTNGTIHGNLFAYNRSLVTINGGSIGQDVIASHHSVINLHGGSIGGKLIVKNTGLLDLYGTNLSSKFTQTQRLAEGVYRAYSLAGKLEDGTSVNNKVLLVESNKLESTESARFTLHNPAALGTILTSSEGQHFFLEGTKYWTPQPTDIARLEADLPTLAKTAPAPRPHGNAAPQSILTYYRQYIGVIQNGRRVIYVNSFHPSKVADAGDWRQQV